MKTLLLLITLPLAAAPITVTGAATQTGADTWFLNLHNSRFYGNQFATFTLEAPVTSLILHLDNTPYAPGTGLCAKTEWKDYGCFGVGEHFAGPVVIEEPGWFTQFVMYTLSPFQSFTRERGTLRVGVGPTVAVPEPSTWTELGVVGGVIGLAFLLLMVNRVGRKDD